MHMDRVNSTDLRSSESLDVTGRVFFSVGKRFGPGVKHIRYFLSMIDGFCITN